MQGGLALASGAAHHIPQSGGAAVVEVAEAGGEGGVGAFDPAVGEDIGDRQSADGRGGYADFGQPAGQLPDGAGIDDAAEADPAMGGGAHRAMFAGGVDGGTGALFGRQVFGGPAGDVEFGVPGLVAVGGMVVAFEQYLAFGGDEDRAERIVVQRHADLGEVDGAAEVLAVGVVHRGAPGSELPAGAGGVVFVAWLRPSGRPSGVASFFQKGASVLR